MDEHTPSMIRNTPWIWLFVSIFVITLLLGIYGYHELLNDGETTGAILWLNILYKAIGLFYHGGEIGEKGLILAIARTLAIIFTTWAIAWATYLILYHRVRQWLWLLRHGKKHYVICGVGDRGFYLAKDLIDKHKRNKEPYVVVIESDSGNANTARLQKLGVAVIEGDARDRRTLQSARLHDASRLVALTESDATNLEILDVVKKEVADKTTSNDEALKCYIHVTNRENHVLFNAGGQHADSSISIINLYENAAQLLFRDRKNGQILGFDSDATGAKPVRVLINGFGKMGEAVLVETLLMGHFWNQVPIEIVVMDEDAEARERDFFRRYWEAENNLANGPDGNTGLGLWNLKFTNKLDRNSLDTFTDIIACHDSEDGALAAIHNLWESCCHIPGQDKPRFFVHAPSRRPIVMRNRIIPFGSKECTCSKEFVIDQNLERSARETQLIFAVNKLKLLARKKTENKLLENMVERLNEIPATLKQGERFRILATVLREYDANQKERQDKLSWENLSLFLQGSNKAEKRHIPFKLNDMGLRQADGQKQVQIDEAVRDAIWPWLQELKSADPIFRVDDAHQLLTLAMQTGRYNSLDALGERITALARTEHSRWCAYLVLNNYRHGEAKNEEMKTHNCLVPWDELPDGVRIFDYKNIYQIVQVLDGIGKHAELLKSRQPNDSVQD
jgi:Trk K+ transport system NAD-binding subunit